MARRLSCPAACGIFLDQGSNPYLLDRQVDSLPLSPQGSPGFLFLKSFFSTWDGGGILQVPRSKAFSELQ